MDDEKDYTLFISSLPDKVTDKLLLELFSQAGPVDNISLKKEKGFGFVTFAHHISVPYTLKLFEGLKLFGRQIVMKPRDGSIYANQFNQRRTGNFGGNRDQSIPSTSFDSRQSKSQIDPRNTVPLLSSSVGMPNMNQQWGTPYNNPVGFQLQRPNSSQQMGFSSNSDNRNDRNSTHGGFRDQSRNSFDGKFSGFRGGRDQSNGRPSMSDSGSGSKLFRGNNPPNWNDSGASKNPHSGGNSYGRRDNQGDRNRYNNRQGSNNFGGDFRSHSNDSWNRGNRPSFGGNSSTPSNFGRTDNRNRRDGHFSSQRSDRSGHRPHQNDKPYNRQMGSRSSHDGFSKNDFNKFGGRRP